MTDTPSEELDGRLNAQREAISLLFALMGERGTQGDDLMRLLVKRADIADHQEDPGAVPADGFVAQEARRREMQRIIREVRGLVEAGVASNDPKSDRR